MFLGELEAGLDHIKGIGKGTERQLAALGVTSVAGLLSLWPRDWEDRSQAIPIAQSGGKGTVVTRARVIAHDWFGAGRMKTLKVIVDDGTGRAALICFNRPFLESQLPVGTTIDLWGHFFFKYGEIQSTAFEAKAVSGDEEGQELSILPVYPLTAGLQQGTLRKIIREALRLYGTRLEDELPAPIRDSLGLISKPEALRAIHTPSSMEELGKARDRLIFEELFYLEVIVARRAVERKTAVRGPGISRERRATSLFSENQLPAATLQEGLSPLQSLLAERLPFSLTGGQLSSLHEINADMESGIPMARLLQGDVGSGKTLVAFMAALRAIELGGQVAIMAPTELLARQHAENAARLLESMGIELAYLTGTVKASGRAKLLEALESGNVDIALGTHALFSREVRYRNLRLVIVDEQHRFGVVQRSAIMAKGDAPDLLMMSATPIPRTLALTVFGDLDVSIIPGLPSGRQPIKTHLTRAGNEGKVYEAVRAELTKGRQAYFVYPLIDEGEAGLALKHAQGMAEHLATRVYPEYTVCLVHSRVDDDQKRIVMEGFRKGEIQVLVATSVVEVGVDVPNATCMVIEHADRFGLSALHQLRGRVGRGSEQSFCFLVYSKELSEDGKQRLKVMLESHDGFVIAEEDLRLRGPGQIAGIEQSGYLKLGMADPVRDRDQLEKARAQAFGLLERDPKLTGAEGSLVRSVLERANPFSTVAQ